MMLMLDVDDDHDVDNHSVERTLKLTMRLP